MKKCFPERIHDPSIELGVSGLHPHLDTFFEGCRKLSRMAREIRQKWFQGLHLETKKGVKLAVAEPAEDPLSGFKLHRHLTQRNRQGREDLPRVAFADTPLGQRGESENAIRESLCCHRNHPQSCTAICEVVDHSGSDPNFIATAVGTAGCVGLIFRCGFRTRLRFFTNVGEGVHQQPKVISDHLELTALRRFGALEQVFRLMARVSDFPETHHPARALECVQFSSELSRRPLVFSRARGQFEDSIQTLARFFKKECVQIVVSGFRIQIFVQFKRFTSTPRVPTISSSASRTAIAIVKQGSSVKSDS